MADDFIGRRWSAAAPVVVNWLSTAQRRFISLLGSRPSA